jgi:serine protease Do
MDIYHKHFSFILMAFITWIANSFYPTNLFADDLRDLEKISNAFESLTEKVSPAVVQVSVTSYAPGTGLTGGGLIYKQRGMGSGVLIDPSGYIITNYHVVEGAISLKILLPKTSEASEEYQSILKPEGKSIRAEIIGVDRETDIAVIKIDGTELPYLTFGDSDLLNKGELVFAFGSPLGLENSVSMGVISSVARQLVPEDPMIYIQTDTPINPGNSGGPLVNAAGEVVGINTLIFSHSGGSEGIGFAAPSNIVQNVYAQIRKYGKMRRANIGVRVQTITPVLAAGLNLPLQHGVILSDVYPDGSAYKAGLRPGDIVLTLDNKKMENGRQFEVNLYRKSINEVVQLEILRGKQKKKFWIPAQESKENQDLLLEMVTPEKNLIARLGVLVLDLDESLKKVMPVLRKEEGVVVVARAVDAPFLNLGLIPGDIIFQLNNQAVPNIENLRLQLQTYQAGDAIVLEVQRRNELIFVAFEIEE